jgi:hypothetical protein
LSLRPHLPHLHRHATYLVALENLEGQVAKLVPVVPSMPPTPDQVARRVAGLAEQLGAFLAPVQHLSGSVLVELIHHPLKGEVDLDPLGPKVISLVREV